MGGAITSYYVYGMGLAYKVGVDGTHYYYHFDPLGSTIAMTDDARGIQNSYAYDPSGKTVNKTENTPNPFQFVGQYGLTLEPNGLIFMRARYYSTDLGRFISRDTVQGRDANTQNLNFYTYALQNPVLQIDPTGNLVFSEAIGLDASTILGLNVAVALVADDKGNHGYSVSGGFDLGAIGGSVNGSFSILNDDSIFESGATLSVGWEFIPSVGGGAAVLTDSNLNVKGIQVSFGAGLYGELPGGLSVSWGKAVPLSDTTWKVMSYVLPAMEPMLEFERAVKQNNAASYRQSIKEGISAAPKQSGPFLPRGPEVGPPTPKK